MIIRKLELSNFRNYEKLTASFNEGINYIYGENASGKTNILEAIYFLSLTRSFRTSEIDSLIKKDQGFARIFAQIDEENVKRNVEISFDKNRKKVLLNNRKVTKISELNKFINVISFIPKNTNLLKDAPKERRKFLDIYISKYSADYLKVISDYQKILKERNDAFKSYNINKTLIEILTRKLIELILLAFKFRNKFIKKINENLSGVYKNISLKDNNVEIKYLSFINEQDDERVIANKFKDIEEEEYKRKQTLIGIHKDDFEIYIDSKNVSLYGSQGENRMSVLSLVLSLYFLAGDSKPIIVLDDVLSELDEKHEENLLNYLADFNQVFITNTAKSQYFHGKYYFLDNKVLKEE